MGWSTKEEYPMENECILEKEEEDKKGEIYPLCPNINALNAERTRLQKAWKYTFDRKITRSFNRIKNIVD